MENNNNGVQTSTEVAGTQQPANSIDYEKEFKSLTEKYNSLNNDYMKKSDAYDKVSSENADYKRKERDKLSDEEKRNQEFQELLEANKKMEARIASFELEKQFADNGFTPAEREKFMTKGITPAIIAEIIKERLDENTKSLQASLIKNSTPASPLGNGTTSDPSNAKSDFAKFQEEKAKKATSGNVGLFNKR